MATKLGYSHRHPAVKRIMQEIRELQQEDSPEFKAEALEENIFEWHFAIRGPPDTDFEGGIYHGRILLPSDYPFKPPEFIMLSPNGRWETNTKICLSISSHHPEHWQPSWSVRTALMALKAFMPTPANGAIGSLDYPQHERQRLAGKSRLEPPKFGSSERQEVAAAIHKRMLAANPEVEQKPFLKSEELQVTEGQTEPVRETKMGEKSQPALEDTSSAKQRSQLIGERSRLVREAMQSASTQHTEPSEHQVEIKAAVPTGSLSRAAASAAVRSRDVSGSSALPQAGREVSTRPKAAVQQELVMNSWEERGLNFLVVAILLAIVAILGRKALSSSDIADFT